MTLVANGGIAEVDEQSSIAEATLVTLNGRFLTENAVRAGSASGTLMQISPVSRGQLAPYRSLRQEIEGLTSRLNGEFADSDWVPVRYLNKSFPRAVLAGFYRTAQIFCDARFAEAQSEKFVGRLVHGENAGKLCGRRTIQRHGAMFNELVEKCLDFRAADIWRDSILPAQLFAYRVHLLRRLDRRHPARQQVM